MWHRQGRVEKHEYPPCVVAPSTLDSPRAAVYNWAAVIGDSSGRRFLAGLITMSDFCVSVRVDVGRPWVARIRGFPSAGTSP